MAATVRGFVREMQWEIGNPLAELQPNRAAELLTRLTALIGNINDEIREADMVYASVLLRHLESEAVANRAKIRAETTPEYQRKREAHDTKELATELIRSLKYYLRSKQDEYQFSKHM